LLPTVKSLILKHRCASLFLLYTAGNAAQVCSYTGDNAAKVWMLALDLYFRQYSTGMHASPGSTLVVNSTVVPFLYTANNAAQMCRWPCSILVALLHKCAGWP
jgi:hypothetical protein